MLDEWRTNALPHTKIVMPGADLVQCGSSPQEVKQECSERKGCAANGSLASANEN
jgi:hypothetical protein